MDWYFMAERYRAVHEPVMHAMDATAVRTNMRCMQVVCKGVPTEIHTSDATCPHSTRHH